MKTLLFLCVLLFFISCSNGKSESSSSEKNSQEITIDKNEFFKIVNDHRRSLGLKEFIYSNILQEIALSHSEDMADHKVSFGHDGFSSRCSEARSQLGGHACAENVAKGQKTSKAVFASWLKSSGHKRNLESSKYTMIGIGRSLDQMKVSYWTLIFLQNSNI